MMQKIFINFGFNLLLQIINNLTLKKTNYCNHNMPVSPFLAFTSLGGLFKPRVIEALCAICLFLWGVNWHASGFFIVLLVVLNYFILSVSKCGCYPNEDGCTYMRLHRTDGH